MSRLERKIGAKSIKNDKHGLRNPVFPTKKAPSKNRAYEFRMVMPFS